MKIELLNNNYSSKELLDKLYNNDLKLVVNINYFSKKIDCTVDFKNLDGSPDCRIGHFGYNFYYRTPKGCKGEKYCTLGSLISAIKRMLKANNININSIEIIKKKYDYPFKVEVAKIF